MRILLFFCLWFLSINTLLGQQLYIKTFGQKKNKALIFLHGGPGYNAAGFESTCAKKLAEQGFFVVVYDRRGEGRSIDSKALFNFKQTFEDLNAIYKKYGIKKAVLIGHSFGGVVGTLFAKEQAQKVEALLLLGAPVSLQETFKNILTKCRAIYETVGDHTNLAYLDLIEKMDTSSVQYSSYCFMHAMQNKFYSPKNPNEEAKSTYEAFKADTSLSKFANQMTMPPTMGFWINEKYTTIDLQPTLEELQKAGLPIYGIYGKEDGLYSTEQVKKLEQLIGTTHLRYYDDCSHNPFMDQPSLFLAQLKTWFGIKPLTPK